MKNINLYDDAVKNIKINNKVAKSIFEQICFSLGHKPLNVMSDEELRVFALSNMQLFLLSHSNDVDKAENAINAIEEFLKRCDGTSEIYEAYVLVLELTYQYEKSYSLLKSLLHKDNTKELALKFLSSYVYCAEGLQKYDEHLAYKKQLIDITADLKERQSLQKELKPKDI